MTANLLSQETTLAHQPASYPLYGQLINEVQRLPLPAKQVLQSLYTQFSQGITPSVVDYLPIIEDATHALVNIATHSGVITTCFGCQCASAGSKPTEHVIEWGSGKVYAWCIWDAFFISQQVGRAAQISTLDSISQDRIDIFFDGSAFITSALWFSFPLATSDSNEVGLTESVRACFCCRTKAFTSLEHAKWFASLNHCEVIDIEEMLARTQKMVAALTSPAMS
ncbi:MAG: organomercurial lyase [Psychrobacter sp.]|nr:organomercurial lyase [Psychrobacter sp.]